MNSFVKPFLVENLSIRGRVVHIEDSLYEIVNKHNYPHEVSLLLSEILVFLSILGSDLKSNSIITCQVTSDDGLVNLIVADYRLNDDYKADIRGYAEFKNEHFADGRKHSMQELFVNAKMIVTMDLGDAGKRYQGIVEMVGESIADIAMEYMKSSMQIDAHLKISVDYTSNNYLVAGGIIIEKLPEKENNIDSWDKVKMFVNTLSKSELLLTDISEETLLYRLFHEDKVYTYDNIKLDHICRCSREKMEKSLLTISEIDRESLKIDGVIAIKCQFCGKEEKF